MKRASHIIWGASTEASAKVELLRKEGNKEIYVLDENQKNKVREKDGVIYISLESANLFLKNSSNVVHHWYKPPGQVGRKEGDE